jgi:hypothetical protein
MPRILTCPITLLVLAVLPLATACAQESAPPSRCSGLPAAAPAGPGVQRINLGERLAAGSLRGANRRVSAFEDVRDAVRVSEAAGPGVVWINGLDFTEGTIAVEVCGRDVPQRSFLGVAFHRQDDNTYESVYVRPFNFRASDRDRHQHAVQYMKLPDYDWPRLRRDFAEEFENPVAADVSPAGWISLRVEVAGKTVRVFVGNAAVPALEARKLGALTSGLVGLWVGNDSDGGFANLRVSAGK